MVTILCAASAGDRPLCSTTIPASEFMTRCKDSMSTLVAAYGAEPNNYAAYAYYSNGSVYISSKSGYDMAKFIVM